VQQNRGESLKGQNYQIKKLFSYLFMPVPHFVILGSWRFWVFGPDGIPCEA
jgi:hypothetical protein